MMLANEVLSVDYTSIFVAFLSLTGTLAGSYFSNRKSQTMIAYRLEQLEQKVEVHNHFAERMYKIEENQAIINEQIKNTDRRLTDIEKAVDK